ncbi:TetR/AcrR family transcriptional regulator [Pseudonocardia sp. HH130630-07]|uniref:TetR/AcrR family transcriptional regulator n=1 Tax=Pseudonocardia sp. HH130630-07 TaxID=1690815 RepID=UPI000814F7B2|nr:TetR/AcrR family transcriptional regulator [Pseudonocardia sp. HH130630-07]ANY05314.1 hypothetical protein AFB00_02170 [Pseudonocardia sp. HH130630-07]
MPRWKPDAQGRLERAALELFTCHGVDETMVADIADRAGVTTCTFYNHFRDKAEVVFRGHAELCRVIEDAVRGAAPDEPPFAVLAIALRAGAARHEADAEAIRVRHALITGHPALRERELLKRAGVGDALVSGLRARGLDDRTATLLGAVGLAVFTVAYDEWIDAPASGDCSFGDLVDDALSLLDSTDRRLQ